MGLGRKARRNAERLEAARRKNVIFRAVAMSIILTIAWKIGMKGGGVDHGIRYLPLEGISPREKMLYPMLIGNIESARAALTEALTFEKFQAQTRNFWETVQNETNGLARICQAECKAKGFDSELDYLRCVTYLCYMMMADWGNNTLFLDHKDVPPGISRYINRMKVFADKIITEDSPLIQPMSNAYWLTREELQGFPARMWLTEDTLEEKKYGDKFPFRG